MAGSSSAGSTDGDGQPFTTRGWPQSIGTGPVRDLLVLRAPLRAGEEAQDLLLVDNGGPEHRSETRDRRLRAGLAEGSSRTRSRAPPPWGTWTGTVFSRSRRRRGPGDAGALGLCGFRGTALAPFPLASRHDAASRLYNGPAILGPRWERQHRAGPAARRRDDRRHRRRRPAGARMALRDRSVRRRRADPPAGPGRQRALVCGRCDQRLPDGVDRAIPPGSCRGDPRRDAGMLPRTPRRPRTQRRLSGLPRAYARKLRPHSSIRGPWCSIPIPSWGTC